MNNDTASHNKFLNSFSYYLFINFVRVNPLMQLVTIISTIDDLNYPEKTNTYYVVNAPYIFSACWKVSTLRFSFVCNSGRLAT